MQSVRRFALALVVLLGTGLLMAQSSRPTRDTAWESMLSRNPAVADDASIGWRERLILNVLTPEQAQAWARGAKEDTLLLDDGQTLKEYLDSKLSPPAGVFVALATPCTVFGSQVLEANRRHTMRVRGTDLSDQGGSATGCGIPAEATAVMLQLKLEEPTGPTRVKIWSPDGPEPAESILEAADAASAFRQATAVVSVPDIDGTEEGLQLRSTGAGILSGEITGYFRRLRSDDGLGGGVSLLTETTVLTAVGDGALANNVTGSGVDDGENNTAVGVNALNQNTTGDNNTAVGHSAGVANTTGSGNAFVGTLAGGSNTTGSANSFLGDQAGASNTTGGGNTYVGQAAGTSSTEGVNNTFVGYLAGQLNTTAGGNSYFGMGAGTANTVGVGNTMVGFQAGWLNEASSNTFVGASAGSSNTSGFSNSFFGHSSGPLNTTGINNSFFGQASGNNNTEGSENTFLGMSSGFSNTTGGNNVFVGSSAGFSNTTGIDNSFVGKGSGQANTEGSWNSFLGSSAGASNTTGWSNSFFGVSAGGANTDSCCNSFFGHNAGAANTAGANSFFGSHAGQWNTTGSGNSFFGQNTGQANTTGGSNSFFGVAAGNQNTTGESNSLFGALAGFSNTTGFSNAFFGSGAGATNTTGDSNAFFGTGAAGSNDTGRDNAFFGNSVAPNNTGGSDNAFFGNGAGSGNSTGSQNVLVGRGAGASNTTENGNSFVGAWSNGTTGITNSTAIGYAAQVSQSNSLVLGSISGLNGASADVSVGIGTATPSVPLHIVRSNGTAQLKVEETSTTTANRVLFRLTNNGAPWFKLLNSNTAQEWTFAMDQYDNFIFSRIGTGGAEFKIYQSGEVTMGPGGSEVFDLQPTGDLEIAGGLTAGGIYYASDRNKKTDVEPLDRAQVMETIARLPISTWRFKTEDTQIRHAGPMAQDFYAAFGLGTDDKTIGASDISGVALAAIQGLYEQTRSDLAQRDSRIEAQEQQLAAQQVEIEELKQAVAALRSLVHGQSSGTDDHEPSE